MRVVVRCSPGVSRPGGRRLADKKFEVPIVSNSSKKRTKGAVARALSKTSQTLASDSVPLMLTKLAEHSLATALAVLA